MIKKSKFLAKTENFFLILRFPSNKNFYKKNAKNFYRISQTAFFRKIWYSLFFSSFFNKMRNFLWKKIREKCQVSLYNFLISLLKTESNISLKRIFVLIFLHNAKQKVDFKTDIKSGMTFLDNLFFTFSPLYWAVDWSRIRFAYAEIILNTTLSLKKFMIHNALQIF